MRYSHRQTANGSGSKARGSIYWDWQRQREQSFEHRGNMAEALKQLAVALKEENDEAEAKRLRRRGA